jgi:thiol-disulfide isomerase/thioredoxin
MRALVAAAMLSAACTASAKQPSLSEVQGEITVVAFWATWCAPCRHELPLLEALHQKYKNDGKVRVVAVSVDSAGKASKARRVAKELGLTMPLIVDEALYASFFGGGDTDVPRLAVIDRKRGGLERNGALAGETPELFVATLSTAIEAVRTGKPQPPTPQWNALAPAK